jgi:hypothetical protein
MISFLLMEMKEGYNTYKDSFIALHESTHLARQTEWHEG